MQSLNEALNSRNSSAVIKSLVYVLGVVAIALLLLVCHALSTTEDADDQSALVIEAAANSGSPRFLNGPPAGSYLR